MMAAAAIRFGLSFEPRKDALSNEEFLLLRIEGFSRRGNLSQTVADRG